MPKVKSTKSIMACLNTSVLDVKTLLENKGYNFRLIISQGQKIGKQRGTIIGFTCLSALIHYLPKLKRPPILWEGAAVVRHVMLNQSVKILDASVMTDGLIFFNPLDTKTLYRLVKRKFRYKSKIRFEKAEPKQLGNGSKLSILFNEFLSTLPDYIHEATIISLVSSVENNDYSIMDEFVKKERLLTYENKKDYKKFAEYLTTIEEYLENINDNKKRKKSSDKETIESIRRIKFLIKHFSSGEHRMEEYKDKEGGVNITSVKV